MEKKIGIAVIGLGYVGLPLAVAFSKKFQVIGYDSNKSRISELKKGFDKTGSLKKKNLKNKKLHFCFDINMLKNSNIFLITVPTPVTKSKKPDLKSLINATTKVAKIIDENSYVVFESTVYPGLTEEVCIPILEKYSKLKLNKNLFVGYSPERINPGDNQNSILKIKKIVSGSNIKTLNFLNKLYNSVLKGGTHKVKSIKIAEAAKISENAQRDLNISLMNELSLIYSKMDIDTNEVLKAMKTKWNALKFLPGLVGGHCISVDPYYLTYKSEKLGYRPSVIHSGRKINEFIPKYIIQKLIKILRNKKIDLNKIKVGVFGLSFKEDCKDFRNSKVINMINELQKKKVSTLLYDPIISIYDFKKIYKGMKFWKTKDKVDVIILSVAHKIFKNYSIAKLKTFFNNKEKPILIDVKSIYNKQKLEKNGFTVWSL